MVANGWWRGSRELLSKAFLTLELLLLYHSEICSILLLSWHLHSRKIILFMLYMFFTACFHWPHNKKFEDAFEFWIFENLYCYNFYSKQNIHLIFFKLCSRNQFIIKALMLCFIVPCKQLNFLEANAFNSFYFYFFQWLFKKYSVF